MRNMILVLAVLLVAAGPATKPATKPAILTPQKVVDGMPKEYRDSAPWNEVKQQAVQDAERAAMVGQKIQLKMKVQSPSHLAGDWAILAPSVDTALGKSTLPFSATFKFPASASDGLQRIKEGDECVICGTVEFVQIGAIGGKTRMHLLLKGCEIVPPDRKR